MSFSKDGMTMMTDEEFNGYCRAINELKYENKRLHSIIKEVREYIWKHTFKTQAHFDGNYWIKEHCELLSCYPSEVLEILNKVDDKND